MKIHNLRFLLFFCIIFLFACRKENLNPSTIWGAMPGKWKLDEKYYINGELFTINECEKSVLYQIDHIGNIHDDCGDDQCQWHISNYELVSRSESDCQHQTFISAIDNEDCPNMSVFFPVGKQIRNSTQDNESKIKAKYIRNGNDWYKCNFSSITLDQINNGNVSLFIKSGLDGYVNRFKVRSFTDDKIEIETRWYIYNREINGEKIPDTIRYSLKRSNTSSTFTVEDVAEYFEKYKYHESFSFNDPSGCTEDETAHSFDGISNLCGVFDGTNHCYPKIVHNIDFTNLNFRENGYALSIWFKPTNTNIPVQTILSQYDGNYGSYKVDLIDEKVAVRISDGYGNLKVIESISKVNENKWSHLIINDFGGKIDLYLNGEFENSEYVSLTNYSNGSKLIFGASGNNHNEDYFNGRIDEFVIFTKPPNAGVIKNIYNYYLYLTYNPYDFCETSISEPCNSYDLIPISPNTDISIQNILSLSNNALISNEGVFEQCTQYDGTKSGSTVGEFLEYPKSYIVVNFWIKPYDVEREEQIILSRYWESSPIGNFNVYLNYGELRFDYYDKENNNYVDISTNILYKQDEWSMVTLFINDEEIKFYKDLSESYIFEDIGNGIHEMLKPSGYGNIILGSNNQILWQNSPPSASNFFGLIDEYFIYESNNYDFTVNEMKRIQNWYLENGNF